MSSFFSPQKSRRNLVNSILCAIFSLFVFLFLLVLVALPTPVSADPVAATGLVPGASTKRNLSMLNVTRVDAIAGNITRLDIDALSITQGWQGYYGNVSGSMVLANAENQSFYEWNNGTSVSGEIYASRNDSIDWDTINCSTPLQIAAEESALGMDASDVDSVSNTFNGTGPAFTVAGNNLNSCPATNVFVNGAAQGATYHQILLADGADRIVYSTIIDHASTGFDGNQWDFQLMVGENGHLNSDPTHYYFWVELGS